MHPAFVHVDPAAKQCNRILLKSNWHGFYRPDDAAEDEVGVEDAEGDLGGVLLSLAHRGDDQADCSSGDALKHRQQEYPDYGAFCRNLKHEDIQKKV